jgi:hypothetical protein
LQQEDEGEEDQKILEKQQLSQVTEISIMAGEGSRLRLHVHGLKLHDNPNSRFQEMMMTQASQQLKMIVETVLVKVALEAGVSLQQICQGEEELSTPSSTKECKHLKEGSIVKKVIDI